MASLQEVIADFITVIYLSCVFVMIHIFCFVIGENTATGILEIAELWTH